MKCSTTNLLTWCAGACIVASFVFTVSECKTVSSKVEQSSSKVASESSASNVLIGVAKSLANRALSEFQESARRNPRLGMNFTLPIIMMPNQSFPGGNLFGSNAQLSLGTIAGSIGSIKAGIISIGLGILTIIFLLTGIAYFSCNIGIIKCADLGGGLGNVGGGWGENGGGFNPFSRTGYDYRRNLHRSTSAVYNALDDGQKKYT